MTPSRRFIPLFVWSWLNTEPSAGKREKVGSIFWFRYIDAGFLLNNSKFGYFVDRIYSIDLEIKDTTETERSASYLDLKLEIDSKGVLRTKLYDKRDDVYFPIVNFRSCLATFKAQLPTDYIFLRRYVSSGLVITISFYWVLLLTRKLLEQVFPKERLKSSFRKFFGRQHDLVDRYEIPISQMTMDIFPLSWQQIHFYTGCDLHWLLIYTVFVYWLVEQELLPLEEHLISPFFVVVVLL